MNQCTPYNDPRPQAAIPPADPTARVGHTSHKGPWSLNPTLRLLCTILPYYWGWASAAGEKSPFGGVWGAIFPSFWENFRLK